MSPDRIRILLWGDDIARTRTLLAVGFAVAAAVYLLVVHAAGIETEVIRDRYWKNAQPLFDGELPDLEYPPLALVLFAVPRLACSTPWGYETAYVAMMWAFVVAGLVLSDRLAAVLGRSRRRAMCLYSLMVLLMLEFVLDRFDMAVAVFILAALLLFVEDRIRPSFLMLVIATLIKVVPAVLFPVMLLCLLSSGRRRDALEGAAVYIVAGAVVMAVFWLIDPDLATGFLSYNTDRPLQIESVAAALVYPLSMLGVSDMWIQSAGDEGSFLSDNLRGALPDDVAALLLPVMVAAVAAVWILYACRARTDRDASSESRIRLMAVGCLAVLLVFLATNKVLSSQYLLWLIGPVLLVATTSPRQGAGRLVRMWTAVVVLTQVNFAYSIGYLGGGSNIDDLGMLILLARALLLLALTVLCLRALVLGTSRTGGGAGLSVNG